MTTAYLLCTTAACRSFWKKRRAVGFKGNGLGTPNRELHEYVSKMLGIRLKLHDARWLKDALNCGRRVVVAVACGLSMGTARRI